jgi:hypothetical protein
VGPILNQFTDDAAEKFISLRQAQKGAAVEVLQHKHSKRGLKIPLRTP